MNPNKRWKTRFTLIVMLCAVFTLMGVIWLTGEGLASEDAITSLDGSVKIASPDSVSPGGQVLYSIVLNNSSLVSDTGQVIVSDMLPAEIVGPIDGGDVSINPPGSALFDITDPSYITFTVPSVPANSVVTLAFQADIATAATIAELITNTAVISYDGNTLERSVTVNVQNRFVYLPFLTRDADLHPFAPVLNIDSDNGQGNYTLSWVYNFSFPTPTAYQFQEATDAAFTNLTIDGIRTAPQIFTGQALGTYYYRVRGINAYGPGPWSNSQMILVEEKGFFDDFSNPSSGWLTGLYDATDSDAEDVIDFAYTNNEYRMWIKIAGDGSHNEKTGTVFAPYDNTASVYTVEVDQHWTKAHDVGAYEPLNSKAALIFAATDDYSRIYSVEWNYQGKCKVWRNWEVRPPVDGVDLYHSDTFWGWGSSCGAHGGYDAVNHVKVEVVNDKAYIYMNGNHFYTLDADEIQSLYKVGLIVGSWDWTPVDSRYDNFRVTLP